MTDQSPYAQPAQPASPSGFGKIAFALGAAAVALQALFVIGQGLLIGAGLYDAVGPASAFSGFASGLLAVGALVFGLVALGRKEESRAAAAAGAALGASVILLLVSGFLSGAIVSLLNFV